MEKELKITRLYEYYIETMSRNYQKMLPRMIRMYFSYNNTLSDAKKAFVYSNVIRNKEVDKTTYPVSYTHLIHWRLILKGETCILSSVCSRTRTMRV